jgi:hypothetical protein
LIFEEMNHFMSIETQYFEEASSTEHTQSVLSIVKHFLEKNTAVNDVIAATTEGTTGLQAAKSLKKWNVVIVSHQTGFKEPNMNELSGDRKKQIEQEGATVLTATHAFAGVARSFRKELGTWTPTEMMAVAYRTFGQGTKVCAEIALMAADAGLVNVDDDVICIAGSGRGADTAWVVRPANSDSFPRLKMRACLCKPLNF